MSFQDVIPAIRAAKTLVITAHVGPDGDTIGSMLALMHALPKTLAHLQSIHGVITGPVPETLVFLPGTAQIKNIEVAATEFLPAYDLAISVDCGSLDRLGMAENLFKQAKTSLNIDHHISNERFGTLNLVVPTAAASAEVVADLLEEMDIALDASTASCLYAGLLTDTGGFKYSNTNPKVFQLAAKLVEAGADPEQIYKHMFEIRPWAKVLLHARALQQTQFNAPKTLGWTSVTRKMLSEYQALDEHVDGIVEGIRQVNSVLVAAVFKETRDGYTKVSLRSDWQAIDVASILQNFGGGGHKMAAGCTFFHPLNEAQALLLPVLENTIQQAQKAFSKV